MIRPLQPGSATYERRSAPTVSNPVDFISLSDADQVEARDLMVKLSSQGRLFAQDTTGQLVRANGLTAFRALQFGAQKLYSVTPQVERRDESHSSSSNRFYQDQYSGFSSAYSGQAASNERTTVQYTTTPVDSFGDLLWLNPDGMGIPGAAALPQAGSGTVTTSAAEASSWVRQTQYAELNMGLLRTEASQSNSHRTTLGF